MDIGGKQPEDEDWSNAFFHPFRRMDGPILAAFPLVRSLDRSLRFRSPPADAPRPCAWADMAASSGMSLTGTFLAHDTVQEYSHSIEVFCNATQRRVAAIPRGTSRKEGAELETDGVSDHISQQRYGSTPPLFTSSRSGLLNVLHVEAVACVRPGD
jgi:hypothetical protein